MQYKYFFTAVLLGMLAVCGCENRKENRFVREVAGQWQVESITYRTDAGDSVVTASNYPGQFYFERCNEKNTPDGRCNGYYQFDGKRRIDFGYSVGLSVDYMTFQVSDYPRVENLVPEERLEAQRQYWEDQPQLWLNYQIVSHSENRLVLQGTIRLSYIGNDIAEVAYPAILTLTR
ncbi:MAG TPA: hypothetical protein VF646_03860 [Cytophagales bacterium]|jgi:hypothetical protein